MKQNVGTWDRLARFILAVIIGYLFFTNVITGLLGIVLVAVGAVLALTALSSNCPLHNLLGINSCEVRKHTS